jgi:phosphoglycerate dehydrogenase-like enzyme
VSDARVVVTFAPPPGVGGAIDETLGPLAEVTYLPDVGDSERSAVLRSADAVLTWFVVGELRAPEELELLGSASLLQLYSAGVDRVPFDQLPPDLPVAANAGAYADPMAEHVLAMALALAKRLPQNHEAMKRGEFDQQTPTRAIRGATVGILGFGGIGQASARLFRALGVRVHALNRSGRTDQPVDAIGTLGDLDALLEAADVVVISLPLTRTTRGLIGRRELGRMKRDAILVNVARAAIVDEDALYEHLRANPSFSAGIDTWWQEPREGGTFTTRHPFLDLPNVIGSPHNSALTPGALAAAARYAADNIARYLRGEPVEHLIDRSEYDT